MGILIGCLILVIITTVGSWMLLDGKSSQVLVIPLGGFLIILYSCLIGITVEKNIIIQRNQQAIHELGKHVNIIDVFIENGRVGCVGYKISIEHNSKRQIVTIPANTKILPSKGEKWNIDFDEKYGITFVSKTD